MDLRTIYGIYDISTNLTLQFVTNPYNNSISEGENAEINRIAPIACSSNGKDIIVGPVEGTSGYLRLSNDYGQSWRILGLNAKTGWETLTMSDNGRYICASTWRNGMFYSNDYGKTLNRAYTFVGGTNNYISSSSCGQYVVFTKGATNTPVLYSDDHGTTWNDGGLSEEESITVIPLTQSSSGKFVVVAFDKKIYVSSNYGRPTSWSSPINGPDASNSISSLAMSGNGKILYATAVRTIYQTTNIGTINDVSWTLINNSSIQDGVITQLYTSKNGQYIIALAYRMHISKNFGKTWSVVGDTTGVNWSNYSNLSTTISNSGQYISTAIHAQDLGGNGIKQCGVYNCVLNNYTYSYTPIIVAYEEKFNFTFKSVLLDCSGIYYLKNEKNETLSTKTITDTTVNSITFTDISTNSFDYGMSNLFVYKQNDNPNDTPGYDIQISDPMVINATCFLEGTKILAMDKRRILKYIPIEKLKPGMLVKTLSSGFVPIKYIGYSTLYNPGLATRVRDQLFKCTKSAYPELTEDLVLTGNHSILVDTITDEEYTQIIETLGDLFITEERYRLPAFNDKRAVPYEKRGDFRIWNLALEHEDYYANYGIYANGLLVETTSCRYIKEISKMTLIE